MTSVTVRARRHDERPQRRSIPFHDGLELGGSAAAAATLAWAVFHLTGWNAPLGLVLSWFAGFLGVYGTVVRQRHGLLEAKDRLATVFVGAGALVVMIPLALILYFVLRKGIPVVLGRFPHFITHDLQGVGPQDPVSKAGMKHAIIGSLEQVGLATAATVPIGVLAATYLNEMGGRFASVVRAVADAMTGLPTIIAGLFVYIYWVEPRHVNGFSGFAAAMALAVVMLPTVVRTAEEVLRIVSDHLREAALALGAPDWRMILQVVIPTARAGLVTAAILGVARAVGETAPVLLTAFGSSVTNSNPFSGAQADLPLQVYTLIRSPVDNNVAEAWGGALLLVAIILTLFTLARILGTGGPGHRRVTWRTGRPRVGLGSGSRAVPADVAQPM